MAGVAGTFLWTHGGGDRDWRNRVNWSPDPGAGNWPGDGATVQIATADTGAYPSVNNPTAGTFDVEVGAVPGTFTLSNWFALGSTLHDIAVSGENIIPNKDWTGTATVTGAGTFRINNARVGNVALSGGQLYLDGVSASLDGNVSGTSGAMDWGTAGTIIGSFNVSGAVTHVNAANGTLELDATGTLRLGGDATGLDVTVSANTATNNAGVTIGPFTQTGGAYGGTGFTRCSGAISITAGAFSNTGQFRATANLTFRNGWTYNLCDFNIPAGITVTPNAGINYSRKYSGAGTVAGGGGYLAAWAAVDGFWSFTGTYLPTLLTLFPSASASTGQAIVAPNVTELKLRIDTGTITLDAPIIAAAAVMNIASVSAGYGALACGAFGIDVKQVQLSLSDPRSGRIDFGTAGHKIGTGGLAESAGVTSSPVVDFGSAVLELSGPADLDNVTTRNDAAHIFGLPGATIHNVPALTGGSGEKIHAHVAGAAALDGGTNDAGAIDFDEAATPNTVALLGVGS